MPVIGTKTQRAFKKFRQRVKQVETASGLNLLHDLFVDLADKGFLITDWLHPSQLAALAKYLVLFGAERGKKPWFDLARLLNPYKDFWAAAESENAYENDEELLATFVFRFVYQQLPFLVFPERVECLFKRTRELYLSAVPVARQFEDLTTIPLTAFLSIAHKLYALFRRQASADARCLKSELSEAEQAHLDAFLNVVAATPSRFEQLYEETRADTLVDNPYELNPLLRYPIIRLGAGSYAPFPELIPYVATRGLYFYLRDELGKEFSEAFGRAFENYSPCLRNFAGLISVNPMESVESFSIFHFHRGTMWKSLPKILLDFIKVCRKMLPVKDRDTHVPPHHQSQAPRRKRRRIHSLGRVLLE